MQARRNACVLLIPVCVVCLNLHIDGFNGTIQGSLDILLAGHAQLQSAIGGRPYFLHFRYTWHGNGITGLDGNGPCFLIPLDNRIINQ